MYVCIPKRSLYLSGDFIPGSIFLMLFIGRAQAFEGHFEKRFHKSSNNFQCQIGPCTIRSHGTKSLMLVRKLRSRTSKTKAGPGRLV